MDRMPAIRLLRTERFAVLEMLGSEDWFDRELARSPALSVEGLARLATLRNGLAHKRARFTPHDGEDQLAQHDPVQDHP
jgi:hypothetical protein